MAQLGFTFNLFLVVQIQGTGSCPQQQMIVHDGARITKLLLSTSSLRPLFTDYAPGKPSSDSWQPNYTYSSAESGTEPGTAAAGDGLVESADRAITRGPTGFRRGRFAMRPAQNAKVARIMLPYWQPSPTEGATHPDPIERLTRSHPAYRHRCPQERVGSAWVVRPPRDEAAVLHGARKSSNR